MKTCRWPARIVFAVAISSAVPLAWAAGTCESLAPCAARACRLDAESAKAKDKGNAKAIAALERQRADMVHCSDDGIKERRKMALQQAQARIDQREAELKQAEATKNPSKVKKAQRNLESAQKNYADIEKSPL
jgi:Protein of unknown function (DUF1090)